MTCFDPRLIVIFGHSRDAQLPEERQQTSLCALVVVISASPLARKVQRKLITADSIFDPVPDFFSTPAANSGHMDEGRSAEHLLCSALPSSGISCAAFPLSAAPSCKQFSKGRTMAVCTNKCKDALVGPLFAPIYFSQTNESLASAFSHVFAHAFQKNTQLGCL